MLIEYRDFNGADIAVRDRYEAQWEDVEDTLHSLPLHLKASDQANLQGNPIFDPVGTNAAIERALRDRRWLSHIPIPRRYAFLGTDVDFGKDGVILEVQFSNYPFLLNNVIRSELLYKAETPFSGQPTGLLIVVTKAHMFPASQSTLYFEQADRQLSALTENEVLDMPIRLVGLFEQRDATVSATWTRYENPRTSRTVVERENVRLRIVSGRRSTSRCELQIVP